MATYRELRALVNDASFRERIEFALWVVSVDILATGTAPQKVLAKTLLRGAIDTDILFRVAIRCTATPAIAAAGAACTDADIHTVAAAAFLDL